MTKDEALNELEYLQRWRLGDDIPQPKQKKVTEAINIAINLIKNLK